MKKYDSSYIDDTRTDDTHTDDTHTYTDNTHIDDTHINDTHIDDTHIDDTDLIYNNIISYINNDNDLYIKDIGIMYLNSSNNGLKYAKKLMDKGFNIVYYDISNEKDIFKPSNEKDLFKSWIDCQFKYMFYKGEINIKHILYGKNTILIINDLKNDSQNKEIMNILSILTRYLLFKPIFIIYDEKVYDNLLTYHQNPSQYRFRNLNFEITIFGIIYIILIFPFLLLNICFLKQH